MPQEQGRGVDDASQVFAVSGLWKKLPGRDVRHRRESALLYLGRDLLANLVVAGLEPLLAQGFERVVLWPAEPGLVAGGGERRVEPGVEHLGAKEIGAKDIPAAFGNRLFRCPARRHGSPIATHELDV